MSLWWCRHRLAGLLYLCKVSMRNTWNDMSLHQSMRSFVMPLQICTLSIEHCRNGSTCLEFAAFHIFIFAINAPSLMKLIKAETLTFFSLCFAESERESWRCRRNEARCGLHWNGKGKTEHFPLSPSKKHTKHFCCHVGKCLARNYKIKNYKEISTSVVLHY